VIVNLEKLKEFIDRFECEIEGTLSSLYPDHNLPVVQESSFELLDLAELEDLFYRSHAIFLPQNE
jgi:hypothetical protein